MDERKKRKWVGGQHGGIITRDSNHRSGMQHSEQHVLFAIAEVCSMRVLELQGSSHSSTQDSIVLRNWISYFGPTTTLFSAYVVEII